MSRSLEESPNQGFCTLLQARNSIGGFFEKQTTKYPIPAAHAGCSRNFWYPSTMHSIMCRVMGISLETLKALRTHHRKSPMSMEEFESFTPG